MRTRLTSHISYLTFAMLATLLWVSSCNKDPKKPGYEYMPDMYRSPSYETNSSNPNFKDGLTERKPVEGTIPVGFMHFPYPNTKEGYEAAGTEWHIADNMKSAENLTEGKRLYESYCIHCHGAEGNGDGPVVQAGFAPPPSYTKGNSSRGGKMADLSDGKIYHTITYGVNMMGSHASQLLPDERMKIIQYVNELQKLGAPKDTTVTLTLAGNPGMKISVPAEALSKMKTKKKKK